MERVGALIQRMLEQYNLNADKNSLILTAQMLLNELQENSNGSAVTRKKVAVILLSIRKVEISEQAIKQREDSFEKSSDPESIEQRVFDEEVLPPVIESPSE